jgi:hypothetical protein
VTRTAIGLTLALVLLSASGAGWANLRATLEHGSIHEHETVRLTVRVLGDGGPTGEPDFSALEQDFEILTTRTSSEFSSIGGRIQSWTAWIMTLQPKRTGKLEIPSFSLGSHRSEPLELRVTALDGRTRLFIDNQVFFETNVSADAVYVQAQLLLTRTLYYAEGVQLFGELPREPAIEHALVQPLGEPDISRTTRNGQRYRVIEQTYAIFPERSGELTVPSVSIAGSAILPRAEGFSGRRTAVEAASERILVNVLPIPADYPADTPWFPAAEVELLESWTDEPPRLDVGKPSTRALIVRAEQTLASMVPPLAVRYPVQIRTYPERPDLHETATRSGVVGTRVESAAVVSQAPGRIDLPTVELVWFDTRQHEVRRASIPARALHVDGLASTPQPGAASRGPAATPAGTLDTTPMPPSTSSRAWLSLLLLGTLIGAAVYFRQSIFVALWTAQRIVRRTVQRTRRHWRGGEHAAWHALQSACRNHDPIAIHRAMRNWLAHHYGQNEVEAWHHFRREPAQRQAADALERRLYARVDAAKYDAAGLVALAAALRGAARRQSAQRQAARRNGSDLPPLFPDWNDRRTAR